ncbi:hypothetical protein [Alicyclobacillus suci]|uniref:hypothetical protein n=1 Tax=Alicyclobacillus suci TaxID=2816080 RepID=UPI001A8D2C48|nr:hypothetical protein [Alicyclobacillus suci]
MKNEIVRWLPSESVCGKYELDRISLDSEELVLDFTKSNGGDNCKIIFDGVVLSFRNTDEGVRLRFLDVLSENKGDEFYSNWTFFKCLNSTYIDWVNAESYEKYADYRIEHYIFLGTNSMLEVISTFDPLISKF